MASKYADGDNTCRWFFFHAAWIVAGDVHNISDISGMNWRRRQFMLTLTAWIVAGDDLCCEHRHELSPATIHATATIHAVTERHYWLESNTRACYQIITGLALCSQAAADTIIYLWQRVPETPSTVKLQAISLSLI